MSKYLSNARVAAHTFISRFLTRKEEGASLVEYGLLVALIACVCIATITTAGTSISTLFGTIGTKIGDANTAAGGS
jgi:pilus assembly protein Flp/PilA